MALRIIAVPLTSGAPAIGWRHHHIHSVKCAAQFDTSGPTRHRVEVAMDIQDAKETYYTLAPGGVRLDIEVFNIDGIKYIRSKPEGTRVDPLLLLPVY